MNANQPKRERIFKFLIVPIILSLLAAHIIVLYKQPEGPWEIIFVSGYPIAMAFSFVVAFSIFMIVYGITVWLDAACPYQKYKILRPVMQVVCGCFLVMAVSAGAAALYFKALGYNITGTQYFPDYFTMIFGFIAAVNMYYNSEAISRFKNGGVLSSAQHTETDATDEEQLNPALKDALQKYLNTHDVGLIYTENEEVFARLSTGETVTWSFSLSNTMKVLDSDLYFRTSRYQIVRRNIIESVNPGPMKNTLSIVLNAPYSEEVRVSRSHVNTFSAWWFGRDYLRSSK